MPDPFFSLPSPSLRALSTPHSNLSRRKLAFKPLLCRNHRPGLGPSPERPERPERGLSNSFLLLTLTLRPLQSRVAWG
ncbi:uncharacterized protein BP01DRAFT_46045 [Aspergillus saccharolyticus JOP 1030-1]|uniref:Uncharacterized protein n=1 Tax=Aspergillus saccharolyticus JOP 1030-1 TaxID=1450539 RepID=A0A318ZMT6_9EURO|nr:hypothetical protein BP01DRAFT_46045 [Aspergillus saccharolyticus JOP 1030-1]PYH45210.1 hypothetical protein BP01DRAFT_46045 [Aspergillus saccharolyticus JOP 1030-1]